jgi:D-alanine-D-alanine ligase
MRILLLYNEPTLSEDHPEADSEREILDTAEVVEETLRAEGYEIERLGVNEDLSPLLACLRHRRPDVVFNLFEGFANLGESEAHLAGLLEWHRIPFTGCPSSALCLARHKHLAKTLFRGAGLATPDFFLAGELPIRDCPLTWPVIVKPSGEDASIGLDQGSVVSDLKTLSERVAFLRTAYGPAVLVEEYIAGRELNVGLIEAPDLRVLPASEILFTPNRPGRWPIVTFDAKWVPDSSDYESTPPKYPADVSPDLAAKLDDMARRAFRLLGCRDYARADFRVRHDQPYLLELNPNPCFAPEAGLAGGLASAGLSHREFTLQLVRQAAAR